jgi:hypothetical protein
MQTRLKLTLMWLRVATLCALFFTSWTASMYLPQTNPWWRASEVSLITLLGWSALSSYRRRAELRRTKQGEI